MKKKEIHQVPISEINQKLINLRSVLLNVRLRKQVGQIEKPHELNLLRRNIARLLTKKSKNII